MQCPASLQAVATSQPAPPVLLLCMTPYGTECPFGQLQNSCSVSVSFQLFLHPQLLPTFRAAQEAEKFLTQCKHCSKTTKISVCYQHCFPPESMLALRKRVAQSQSKLGLYSSLVSYNLRHAQILHFSIHPQ